MKSGSMLNRLTKWMVLPLSILIISFSANAEIENSANSSEKPTAISYVSTTERGILFNVKHDNAEGSRFRLVIKNEAGDVFYDQSFKDITFDKNVVLTSQPGSEKLIFSIVSPGVHYDQAFKISTRQVTVNDVVINAQ